jgi:sugar lactone lactonase YvrE
MSRLWGSNGIAFGPDGRLYVAQFLAGQISAVDVATGDVEVVVPQGGPVQSPDDLAFGADGSMYITDLVPGWVWRRSPAGEYSLVSDQVAVPNGIATVGDRLFVNEMKLDGRVLELFLDDAEPRVLADGLMMGNAMQLGPDGHLYYPHMLTGQVFRVPLDGGAPELVAEDVHEPVAVRFDRGGVLMVLSRGVAGFVTRIDLAGGERTIVESGVLGLDNAAFDDENRMFVSSFASGGIAELHPDGRTRQVVAQGRVGPYGVAVSGGRVHVADHYTLAHGDRREMYVFAHGVAAEDGFLHTASQYGDVRTYDLSDGSVRMRATGLNRPVGLTVRADGTLVVAEAGAGRVVGIDGDDAVTVLAAGFASPVDVAFDGAQGYVSDEERGAVLRLDDGSPVAEGLSAPQGLAVRAGEVLVVETGERRLLAIDPSTGETRVEAEDLAVGLPPGVTRTDPELFAHGMPGVPRQFAGLAVAPDGTLHISANAEGGVLSLSPVDNHRGNS